MKQTSIAILLSVALFATAAAQAAEDAGPGDVVKAFNNAITERKLTDATSHFAPGAIQYTLRAAHAGVATGTGISSDLKTHWSTIGPVLLGATASYKRAPEILHTRVDGDLATVWARISTETVERSGKRQQNSFSEVYFLVNAGAGWQIGSMADNRGTNSLAAAPAAAAK